VAQLHFGPQADELLAKLESAPSQNSVLLGRLDAALDRLEADPVAAPCRRHRFQNIGVWAVSVVASGEEWLIMWEPGETPADVVIHAIVPAP
jgi:hypothetical protein